MCIRNPTDKTLKEEYWEVKGIEMDGESTGQTWIQIYFLFYSGLPQDVLNATLRIVSILASCTSLAYGLLSIELREKLKREPKIFEIMHFGCTELVFKIAYGFIILTFTNGYISYSTLNIIFLLALSLLLLFLCVLKVTACVFPKKHLLNDLKCCKFNISDETHASEIRTKFLKDRRAKIAIKFKMYFTLCIITFTYVVSMEMLTSYYGLTLPKNVSSRSNALLYTMLAFSSICIIQSAAELFYISKRNKCFIDWIYNVQEKENTEVEDGIMDNNASLNAQNEEEGARNELDGDNFSTTDHEESQDLLLKEDDADNPGMNEVEGSLTSVLIHPEPSNDMDQDIAENEHSLVSKLLQAFKSQETISENSNRNTEEIELASINCHNPLPVDTNKICFDEENDGQGQITESELGDVMVNCEVDESNKLDEVGKNTLIGDIKERYILLMQKDIFEGLENKAIEIQLPEIVIHQQTLKEVKKTDVSKDSCDKPQDSETLTHQQTNANNEVNVNNVKEDLKVTSNVMAIQEVDNFEDDKKNSQSLQIGDAVISSNKDDEDINAREGSNVIMKDIQAIIDEILIQVVNNKGQ